MDYIFPPTGNEFLVWIHLGFSELWRQLTDQPESLPPNLAEAGVIKDAMELLFIIYYYRYLSNVSFSIAFSVAELCFLSKLLMHITVHSYTAYGIIVL